MEWGCMQALIDFDGWRKWKDFSAQEAQPTNKSDALAKKSGSGGGKGKGKKGRRMSVSRENLVTSATIREEESESAH